MRGEARRDRREGRGETVKWMYAQRATERTKTIFAQCVRENHDLHLIMDCCIADTRFYNKEILSFLKIISTLKMEHNYREIKLNLTNEVIFLVCKQYFLDK